MFRLNMKFSNRLIQDIVIFLFVPPIEIIITKSLATSLQPVFGSFFSVIIILLGIFAWFVSTVNLFSRVRRAISRK